MVLPDSDDEDAEISSKHGRNLQEEGLDEMVRQILIMLGKMLILLGKMLILFGQMLILLDLDSQSLPGPQTALDHREIGALLSRPQQVIIGGTLVQTPGLSESIGDLEKQLKETKQTFRKPFLTLVDRVKTLEVALKRKTKRVLLSDFEEKDTEAQGWKTHDLDPLVSLVQELVTPSKTVNASGEEQVEDISPTTLEAAAILTKVQKIKSVDKVKRYKRRKSSKELAGTGLDFKEVKSAFEKVNTGGIRVSVPSLDREEAGLAEAIRLDALEKALEKEEVAKQVHLDSLIAQRMAEEQELTEDEFEKVLWEYLKNMFEEPLSTDSIWSLPGQQRIICWRYYDACRVHCLNLESADVYMLIERKYPLSGEVCKAMLDKKLQGGKPDEDCYKLLKMIEKQAALASPRANGYLVKAASNPLIADDLLKIIWYSTQQGRKGVYQIVRENRTDMVYISFGAMLTDISRDDLTELYSIVMKKHGMNEQRVHCLNLESADVYMLSASEMYLCSVDV
ncbi:hypothetical protein Tco_0997451 [Tanacetum coccineum]